MSIPKELRGEEQEQECIKISLTLSFHNSLSKASHLCMRPLAKSAASCSAYIHPGLPLALLPSHFPPQTLLTNLLPSILIRCPSLLQQTLSSNDLILTWALAPQHS